MSSVYLRKGSSVYWCTYTGHDGKRRRESCHTRDRRAAQRTASNRELLHWMVSESLMSADQLRLKERGREPIDSRKLAEGKDSNVGRFLKYASRNVAMVSDFAGDGVVASLEQWLREEAGRGITPSTINTKLRSVQRFGEWLWRKGWIEVNATKRVKPLSTRGQQRKIKHDALTPLQAERLFAGERGLFYRFRGWTGLRGSEAAKIERRDLDLGESPTLTVRPEVAKNGMGSVVPLDRSLADALIEAGMHMTTGLLFPDVPTYQAAESKQMRGDLEAAGLGREFNGRSLRMSFVTWLRASGVELGVCIALRRDMAGSVEDELRDSVKLTTVTYTDPKQTMGLLRDGLSQMRSWYVAELKPQVKAVRA